MLRAPPDNPPDLNHGGHGPSEEVAAGEGVQGDAVHQGVQQPGEERGEG